MSIVSRVRSFFSARHNDRGAITSLAALAMVPMVAVTAVGADAGRVWVERQRVQTAAESAAMGAAGTWATTGVPCAPQSLQLVAQNAGSEATSSCTTSGSKTAGVVTVTAEKSVGAMFGSIIGRDSTRTTSTASVKIAPTSAASGLRPTALCQNSPALSSWLASGRSTTQIFTINVDGDCQGVPGNWGVLDFDGGANRTTDLQAWINQGWSGTVAIGQEFSGDPGIPSPALQMDSVVGKTIAVPVYDSVRYEGSNSIYRVSGFVAMEIISVRLSGSASSRNLTVRFQPYALPNGQLSGTAPNFGVVSWGPCSLDGAGSCS